MGEGGTVVDDSWGRVETRREVWGERRRGSVGVFGGVEEEGHDFHGSATDGHVVWLNGVL